MRCSHLSIHFLFKVHVRIRGQLAACSGKNDLYVDIPRLSHGDYCGFKYGQAATPTVTGVAPNQASTNTSITLSGTGFSEIPSENYVVFGSVECEVLSSTATRIQCRLGSGFAGFKGLYLHVLYSGVAETNASGLTYGLVLNTITPSQGSQTGGTEVTITGSGFYHEASNSMGSRSSQSSPSEMTSSYLHRVAGCPSGWRNQVTLGGSRCTVIHSESMSLVVRTPAEIVGRGSSLYDLEVSVLCPDDVSIPSTALLPSVFTYDPTYTPSVSTVSPSYGVTQGGQEVTISGDGFSTNTQENEVLVSVVTMALSSWKAVQGELEELLEQCNSGRLTKIDLLRYGMVQLCGYK